MKEIKLSKCLFIASLCAMAGILSSCSSSDPGKEASAEPGNYKKISDAECRNLVENARSVLLGMPVERVSQLDKEYIKYRDPKLSLKYTGDRKGVYNITWEKPNAKIYKVLGSGDLTSFQDSFQRVSIVLVSISNEETKPKSNTSN